MSPCCPVVSRRSTLWYGSTSWPFQRFFCWYVLSLHRCTNVILRCNTHHIFILTSDELRTSHSSETLKLVFEGNKQSINKKNRRATTRSNPCPFLFTANNPLLSYGKKEDKMALASRVHALTFNGPVIQENLPEAEMKKLSIQYAGQKWPFKFSYAFRPTLRDPIVLQNGSSVPPALLDGTVLYGLYLRYFPNNEEIPPFDPAENMHLPNCPWPNNWFGSV